MESAARWLSETLLTVTSDAFTELTIDFPPVYTASENQVRWWNSVDSELDRLSLRGDVTLVVRPFQWVREATFRGLMGRCFPSMWKTGKVVLKIPPYGGG